MRCRFSMPAGEVRPLEEIEAELIRYAIAHYRGQMSEVARRLRIGRSTLYRKLESLGLSPLRGRTAGDGRSGPKPLPQSDSRENRVICGHKFDRSTRDMWASLA